MKWLLVLVVVAVAGFFGYQYMNKNAAIEAQQMAEQTAAEASATAKAALEAAQDSMPAGIDLTKISDGFDGVFGSATDALSGITDAESAQAALPAIEEANGKLSGLVDVATRLPDAAKGPIAGLVESGMSSLQPVIDKVTAIPGVGEIVQPAVDKMVDMLKGLTG